MNFLEIFKYADKLLPALDIIKLAKDDNLSIVDKADKISEILVNITPFSWDNNLRTALMPSIEKFASAYKGASTEENIIAMITIAGTFIYEIGLILKSTNPTVYKWCGFVGKSIIAIAPIADEFDIFVINK